MPKLCQAFVLGPPSVRRLSKHKASAIRLFLLIKATFSYLREDFLIRQLKHGIG